LAQNNNKKQVKIQMGWRGREYKNVYEAKIELNIRHVCLGSETLLI